MRKIILSLSATLFVMAASAQFSVGVNANYTMYKGDLQKATPGAQIRASYAASEKTAVQLSFTYGVPIKYASFLTLESNSGSDSKTINSEIAYKFKTINLVGHYGFLGDDETTAKLYGIVGAGLVLVSYDEKPKESYDHNAYTASDLLSGKVNGFTLNFGLGGEYKLGAPSIFAEAGLALPANQVNGTYVENVIPGHFIFNAGVKFDLSSAE